jgi:phage baseplate assembly protein gpV
MISSSIRLLATAGIICACIAAASCIYIGAGVRLPYVDTPTVSGPMTVDGPFTVGGPLTVSGPVVVHGVVRSREIHAAGGLSTSLPKHGKAGAAGQAAGGPMTIAGPLTVDGPLTVNGPLTVAGSVTAEGFEFLGTL